MDTPIKVPPPWSSSPPANSDATVFYANQTDNAAPQVRQFFSSINLGCAINEDKRNAINVTMLIKQVMSFATKTNADLPNQTT
jgi:hypothetical protein